MLTVLKIHLKHKSTQKSYARGQKPDEPVKRSHGLQTENTNDHKPTQKTDLS